MEEVPVKWHSSTVRTVFIDYFIKEHGHVFVPSSPVVPNNDPTLQFANSGMNQFKPIFLGQVEENSEQAKLKRAVNSQKCIRAGGKMNDLEDVGKDTYHHTFFEMLGNWSFGDYFQEEAIDMAMQLMINVFGLSPDRLYATYFEGDPKENLDCDTKARELWRKYLPEDHILPGNKRDNFWEMGPTGPCGPCSEIHYDRIGGRNASHLVNQDDPNVIEVWNLVFMQFNREADGTLKKLPRRHVDTGMGFERLVSILQDKYSNYDIDIFQNIFKAIRQVTGAEPYTGKMGDEDPEKKDMAYRVIADHIRTLTFAISDGASPGPVGRGYVLRRILRRAIRYGKEFLGAQQGFLAKLVPVVVETMGAFYTKLEEQDTVQRVVEAIEIEEAKFEKSFASGFQVFHTATKNLQPGDTIPAETVLNLYDTHGFPDDLTRLMGEEKGLHTDIEGFERLMEENRQKSRAAHLKKTSKPHLDLTTLASAELEDDKKVLGTDDHYKYTLGNIEAQIVAIWTGKALVDEHKGDEAVVVILDKTNFYGESGGQVGDHGHLEAEGFKFVIDDVKVFGKYISHYGHIETGELKVGQKVTCEVDLDRRLPTMSNHTATHLVNHALRSILGNGVDQQGSVVYPERLRFDYSYNKSIGKEELRRIDAFVCEKIAKELRVYAKDVPLEIAKSIQGIRAMFGEKYPNPVRVVSVGVSVDDLVNDPSNEKWKDFAIELCGGSHLSNIREAELFTIVQEGQHEQGVRRLVAVTGEQARNAQEAADKLFNELNELNKIEDGDKLRLAINDFIGLLEKATIPAWKRIQLREDLEPIQAKSFKEYVARMKEQVSSAGDYIKETVEKLKETNDPFWVDILEVGSNNDALHKTSKALVEATKESPIGVLLLSADVSNPKKPKVIVVSNVPQEIADKGLKANVWAKETAVFFGGKAGGKDLVAQGSGTQTELIQTAKEEAIKIAKKILG